MLTKWHNIYMMGSDFHTKGRHTMW